jgi:hypothetical protein
MGEETSMNQAANLLGEKIKINFLSKMFNRQIKTAVTAVCNIMEHPVPISFVNCIFLISFIL